ncbi:MULTISPECIES: hypothetical protein [Rhizobium]|uniref:DUF4760 domain-containing protein n=1 Tax=Rhizobium indicum TaxID=2583231 RepID=A0ABX6PQW8_9HYPH|nr:MULTISPECIES: hypothetical protein [Rhizobium]NEI63871.1 hypothetical protein [Rhizobium leguminosarum]NKL19297.1 hypothetical protein [Rhizobium leguminosarum bv. viciae]NKL38233.1 hypothetical protein [Rhizobium leguminosarum bv. viciae]NKL57725.1 hypothetical protein [Rhizobium leguminosarum bv. viciae]QKK21056.1 hypothetical protein FFM53_032000 [Rhizobium indicum]
MARFLTIVLCVLLIGFTAMAATVWALGSYGVLALDSDTNRLELLKLVPTTLAFLASLTAAAVSVLVAGKQQASARSLEEFKANLALSGRNVEREYGLIDQAKLAASVYVNKLRQLEDGLFDATSVRDAENGVMTLGNILPRDVSYLAVWYRFAQQGFCIADVAKRRKTKTDRQELWREEGPILGDLFEKVTQALDQERAILGTSVPIAS